ncbi:hypothetical protein PC119_g16582 [Phytophthora cactorum]|uniref:Uncharacterized protein n=1 Tax=Phytophthora cactorum TaxID=29920 RepID=A0A8T1BKW8_9STRA|nr:hypothetical protein PC111_g14465 [Phytophthora cactorum]KAG2904116.1 hypothetical protein PC115_g15098 [Phytophthora cactorum]KAG2920439.1 hypothetical protein PC117_g16493 [Phytophthora cactorum]KAG3001811.1 hypothetical protein PC119_g16582 [Phytophthora cactorum]KAG3071737.1 hypothetical protein PC122_g15536 [Phytophthora cactorum]
MLSIVLRPMRWVWSLGKTPRCTRCAGSRSVLSLRCFSSTILTGDSGLSVSEEEVCKFYKLHGHTDVPEKISPRCLASVVLGLQTGAHGERYSTSETVSESPGKLREWAKEDGALLQDDDRGTRLE